MCTPIISRSSRNHAEPAQPTSVAAHERRKTKPANIHSRQTPTRTPSSQRRRDVAELHRTGFSLSDAEVLEQESLLRSPTLNRGVDLMHVQGFESAHVGQAPGAWLYWVGLIHVCMLPADPGGGPLVASCSSCWFWKRVSPPKPRFVYALAGFGHSQRMPDVPQAFLVRHRQRRRRRALPAIAGGREARCRAFFIEA